MPPISDHAHIGHPGDGEHQDRGDRAAGQADGADDAAAAHVGQPSAGDDADAGRGGRRAG